MIHKLTIEISDYPTAQGGTVQGSLAIAFDRYDGDRCQYHYWVLDHDGAELDSGNDLRSGSGQDPNELAMIATLASFLGAAGEAVAYERHGGRESENARGLFSREAAEWADANSDSLAMLSIELGEEE